MNQLGYFEQLKPDNPNVTERHLDEKNGTVDLTLKVKEKGKNSIGLSGGVSGLAGSFIGLNYSTNNFLGRGETLSVGANIGNLQRDITFSFTEPYFLDKPLQLGFTVYGRKFNYDQARQAAIFSGQQVNLPSALEENLQNYTQSSKGFSVSLGYAIHHSFKRVGISYSYDDSSVVALTTASKQLFDYLAFSGVNGPNALNGIITSKIAPSFSKNTLDSSLFPHRGSSIYITGEFAGLGGTVKTVRPIIEYKKFIPVQNRRNTIGYRVQGTFLTGYGGVVPPPFSRSYLGGENDLRGFDIRSVSPVAFLPSVGSIVLRNPDGTAVPKDPSNPLRGSYTIPIPVDQIVFPGGDFRPDRKRRIPHYYRGPGSAGAVCGRGHRSDSAHFAVAFEQFSIGRDQHHIIRLPDIGYRAELRRWTTAGRTGVDYSGGFTVSKTCGWDELDAAHVHGIGTTGVFAGDQCAVPDLLGLQPAAAGYHIAGTGTDHAPDVPRGSSWRLYLSTCQECVFAALFAEGTAENVPFHRGDNLLGNSV